MAGDARKVARTFGPTTQWPPEGLRLPVSWYQSGPLELALYVPYKLTVTPRPKWSAAGVAEDHAQPGWATRTRKR